MNTTEFNKIVEKLMKHSKETLCKKQSEYNLTADRLDVFKKAARRQMITVPQALLGYMDKHIGSIYDYIHENKVMTEDLATEKIGDAINYLYLLYAVLQEEGFKSDKIKPINTFNNFQSDQNQNTHIILKNDMEVKEIK